MDKETKLKKGKQLMSNLRIHTNLNGDIYWYLDNKLHREDGPAVEWVNGDKCWYLNDTLHRVDGPAVEYVNGGKYWYQHGKLHRDDGPAIEFANGSKCWYLNGYQLTEQEFNEKLKGKQMNTVTSVQKVSRQEAVDLIRNSKGRFITVTFTKKSDGTDRMMNCRLGVKKDLKGTGRKIDTSKFIGVFDLQKTDYRVINIAGIKYLTIQGKEYAVDDSVITPTIVSTKPSFKATTPNTKVVGLEYSVAEGKTIQDLKTEVRIYISKGWKPLGGIVLGVDVNFSLSYTPRYLQAMIKE